MPEPVTTQICLVRSSHFLAFDDIHAYRLREKTARKHSMRLFGGEEKPIRLRSRALSKRDNDRDLHRGHGTLGTWIGQKNWQIIGVGSEMVIQLPRSETEDEVVVEVQLPVGKNSEQHPFKF